MIVPMLILIILTMWIYVEALKNENSELNKTIEKQYKQIDALSLKLDSEQELKADDNTWWVRNYKE